MTGYSLASPPTMTGYSWHEKSVLCNLTTLSGEHEFQETILDESLFGALERLWRTPAKFTHSLLTHKNPVVVSFVRDHR
jgi:hypothetical protein